jgi:hypothetical protein
MRLEIHPALRKLLGNNPLAQDTILMSTVTEALTSRHHMYKVHALYPNGAKNSHQLGSVDYQASLVRTASEDSVYLPGDQSLAVTAALSRFLTEFTSENGATTQMLLRGLEAGVSHLAFNYGLPSAIVLTTEASEAESANQTDVLYYLKGINPVVLVQELLEI